MASFHSNERIAPSNHEIKHLDQARLISVVAIVLITTAPLIELVPVFMLALELLVVILVLVLKPAMELRVLPGVEALSKRLGMFFLDLVVNVAVLIVEVVGLLLMGVI